MALGELLTMRLIKKLGHHQTYRTAVYVIAGLAPIAASAPAGAVGALSTIPYARNRQSKVGASDCTLSRTTKIEQRTIGTTVFAGAVNANAPPLTAIPPIRSDEGFKKNKKDGKPAAPQSATEREAAMHEEA